MILANKRLAGRVAVVTGGASGIGRAISERWLAEGGLVAAGDLSEKNLRRCESELGDHYLGVRTDVRVEDDVEALVRAAIQHFGRLDAGFNAAGVAEGGPIVDLDAAVWQRQLDVLLTGVFYAVKHEARQLVEQGGGAIVNISSINALAPASGSSAYTVAKAGVLLLTKTAALELGTQRVRVNAIAPGLIRTPLAQRIGAFEPDVLAGWLDHIPLGRVGEPDDIAAAAIFLASDEATWITGHTLVVDGGLVNTAYPKSGSTLANPANGSGGSSSFDSCGPNQK